MDVTLLGIEMVVNPEHVSKAPSPIALVPSGMTVFLHPVSKVLVAVSIRAWQLFRES